MNKLHTSKINSARDTTVPFTSKEIAAQPKTWVEIWSKLDTQKDELLSFLERIIKKENLYIILTGAGSSAFIGDYTLYSWMHSFSKPTQAIPTTDLVTHFRERVVLNKPLLLISFARSGNSPESGAVIQLANQLCNEVYHIIITCNADGKLAKMMYGDNSYVFLLPPEAEDQSLAMTNSFTSMALTGMLIPKMVAEENIMDARIDALSNCGEKLIEQYAPLCEKIAELDFNRIVFLGSGPLQGIAKESHLKVQELTNGEIVGKFDSFLGFRHGPKVILNDQTLLVYLMANNKHVHRYEKDLIEQVAQHNVGVTTLAVTGMNDIPPGIDFRIHIDGRQQLSDDFAAVLYTLPAQMIGFYKSLILGYNPDNPSVDGVISRVVHGVTIYSNNANNKTSGI